MARAINQRRPGIRSRRAQRRGVILLVVLGLLTLFTLIGLTFVLSTSQANLGAKAASRSNRTGTPPTDLHRRVLNQVIRGDRSLLPNTTYPQWEGSVIGPHSLLFDLYGSDWLVSTIPSTASGSSFDGFASSYSLGQGSMMYFDVSLHGQDGQAGTAGFDDDGNGTVDDASELGMGDDFQPTNGYYNGRVITMMSGFARYQSSRITGYQVDDSLTPPQGRFRLMPFESMSTDASGLNWQTTGAPQSGDQFLINGRPFNGTGFGYHAATNATGLLDYVDSSGPISGPVALLPNPASPAYRNYMYGADGFYPDEDYDAPDFQNMMLAGQFWNATLSRWDVRLPSLHRPDLIYYWANTPPGAMNDPNHRRKVLLRPEPADHIFGDVNGTPGFQYREYVDVNMNGAYNPPEPFVDLNGNGTGDDGDTDFTGKEFNPVFGPWDVDNDGDGLYDSIWVDPGFPVQTAPDGRRYKVLAAILCLDLDNRLNINVHGNPNHYRMITPAPGAAPDEEYVHSEQTTFAGPYAGAYVDTNGDGRYTQGVDTIVEVRLPIGSGYGPADVSLAPILYDPYADSTSSTGTLNEMRQLFEGRRPGGPISYAIPGRYGDTRLSYLAIGTAPLPRPGITSTGVGIHNGWDGTAGTSDDFYSGDDNRPLGIMAALAGPNPEQYFGNVYQDGYFPFQGLGSNGSPPGLSGSGSVALDLRGQPFWWNSGYPGTPNFPAAGAIPDTIDDPYEMDLNARLRPDWGPDGIQGTADDGAAGDTVAVDAPFTPHELEPVLRYHDADASALPSRIGQLAPLLVNDATTGPLTRQLITTTSYDLPVPSIVPTRDMVLGPDGTIGGADDLTAVLQRPASNLHITDLLRARLLQGGFTGTTAQMNTEIANMLPADLVAGLRMDINRPFGDGLDNNGNGVIDEMQEALAGALGAAGADRLWRNAGGDNTYNTMDDGVGAPFDTNGDGSINAHDSLARYQMAKHLYVLLMLFKDSGYIRPTPDEVAMQASHDHTARRLAQWAINAVEFRDRDSIMTAFEYDEDPFGIYGGAPGWDVDGYLGANPGPDGVLGTADDAATDDLHPDRQLVWGCEYPELQITETLAFHDRRSEDLPDHGGTTAMMVDTHFDQRRIPQGSAFVELYCTRNPNNPVLQGDLYRPNGMLDLGRMDANNTGEYPIWRLVVGPPNSSAAPNADMATLLSRSAPDSPDSTSIELEDIDLLTAGPQTVDPERIVWFAERVPGPMVIDRDLIYYNHSNDPQTGSDVLLEPGQYAVIGPHRHPEPGSGDDNITTVGVTPATPYAQEFRLGHLPATNGAGGRRPVTVWDTSGTNNYPDDPITTAAAGTYEIQEPLGIPVAGPITSWAAAATGPTAKEAGFSISEPVFSDANYYPIPDDMVNTTTTTHHGGSPQSVTIDRYTMPLDVPFDQDPVMNPQLAGLPEGTHLNFKTVFLQRLADPTRPHDTVNNPYLTIDWMPMDLTIFNSLSTTADPSLPAAISTRLGTRQRGTPRNPAAGTPADTHTNLWQQPDWLLPQNEPPVTAAAQPYNFAIDSGHTLGYLNWPFHDVGVMPGTPAWWTTADIPPAQPGYPAGYSSYVGDPHRPFAWLTWLNRPFASSMELLLVPATSSARLTYEFDYRSAPATLDHYSDRTVAAQPPFGHLLNFFQSTDPSVTPPAAGANYYRVLEYLHVPSRFSGTDEALNPAFFQAGGMVPADGAPFYAPFNRISTYREPGRININTIFDGGQTLLGVLNRMQEATYTNAGGTQTDIDPTWCTSAGGISQLWANVDRSRQGFDPTSFMNGFNPASPSILANPFRSFGQNYTVPLASLRNDQAIAGNPQRDYIEGNLLRPEWSATTAAAPRPLFAADTVTGLPYTDSIDSNRNPHFRYQALQKLGNVVTTRSNVYAIWITVGYFEVDRGPVDNLHPDGYRLVREMGMDTGDIQRDRAFYIYDRTIPVGFQPGENLNIDKGILVERVIE